ncbi:hypothetical protein P7K49_038128 [Saguinus oedipus]|uniref:Uncharacterized protein n=1 Tax=Saguinus oedipus TaxID=9490 RepID=A0ABQ9TDS5_SAGOE|nr:hypothetical protein P7K49_038128 [Saguinus oedipus]
MVGDSDIVMTFTRGNLSEQEFITIARHYRVPEETRPDGDFLLALAQEKFKKNFFENFDRFIYACGYEDRENFLEDVWPEFCMVPALPSTLVVPLPQSEKYDPASFKEHFLGTVRLLDQIAWGSPSSNKKNVLPTKDIKRLCKSFRLPLTNDLLESLLSRGSHVFQQLDPNAFRTLSCLLVRKLWMFIRLSFDGLEDELSWKVQ